MPEPGKEETVRVVALDRSFHVNCYKCEVSYVLEIKNIAIFLSRCFYYLFIVNIAFRIVDSFYDQRLKVVVAIHWMDMFSAKVAMQSASER